MDFITIILLGVLFLFVALYLSRRHLFGLLAQGLHLSFFVLILLALLGIFTNLPFLYIANFSLEQSGTYNSLVELDERLPIAGVGELPSGLIDQIVNVFPGVGGSDSTSTEDGRITEAEEDARFISEDAGFFESNLYPIFVDLLGSIIRLLVTATSFLGLIGITYLSFLTSHITELEDLRKRVRVLESKL